MTKLTPETLDEGFNARNALLTSAAKLFARQGYSATGVQQITADAGVNKAMLYYYFGSKENLYDMLVTEGIRAVEEAVLGAESKEGTLSARLQTFVVRYLTIAVDFPDTAHILFREVMGGGERARQTVIAHFSDSFQRLAAIFVTAEQQGELQPADTLFLAYSLFGMATMFIAGHFLVERPLDVVALSNKIVNLFFQGVGVAKSESPIRV